VEQATHALGVVSKDPDAEPARSFRVGELRTRWSGVGRVLVPLATDALALTLAGVLAYLFWAGPVRNQPVGLYLPVLPLLPLIVVAYAQAGLYPGFGLGAVEALRRYWLVTATAFLAMTGLIFALKLEDRYSRVTLGLAFLLSLVLVPFGRRVLSRLARRWSWWREPVVLVGLGERTERAWQHFSGRAAGEFRPVGVLVAERDTSAHTGLPGDPPVLGTIADAREVARAGVQVAFADLDGPAAEAALDHLRLVFPRVIILRDFQELPVEGVTVRNLDGVLGLEYGSNLLRRQARWVKRGLDLAIGSTVLLASLPVMLLAMASVKILSPGPALFWQTREGFKGRQIRVPKIRTMVPDAEDRMEEVFESDPGAREEWESGFKLREDPRIIPVVGRLFRRFSIDELPQLWSVVNGDMSLVGPRPFPAYHLEALSFQARRLRNQVRPGLTGLWQVSARGVADVERQQAYDIYYIRNWSVWLDLYVLARTISAVASGRGAY
jgi:Undecaprenyl-phosphate galactose phosphotransferase WbaP